MARDYYDRYTLLRDSSNLVSFVPSINLSIKGTDLTHSYDQRKDRLDLISNKFYNNPTYGWLIMLANKKYGFSEIDLPDGAILIIPFPLFDSINEYNIRIKEYRKLNA